jgi:predicted glycosyltransferase involved in capsule biosynthesis
MATELRLEKVLGALRPADEESEQYIKALGGHEIIRAKVSKMRNPLFHRKGMALLRLGFNNQDEFPTFRSWRQAVTVETGRFDVVPLMNGKHHIRPHSLDYGSMDDTEFHAFYNDAFRVIVEYLGADAEEIENELLAFA